MPFDRQPQQPSPQYPNNGPLLRVGGLYPSKSGKALTGNIHVATPRQGEEQPFGEILIDLIRQCMEENLPVRCLVFENDGKYPGAPYRVCLTTGRSKPEQAQVQGDSPPEEPAQRPPRRTLPRR